jgi:hypothetical protein
VSDIENPIVRERESLRKGEREREAERGRKSITKSSACFLGSVKKKF